MFHEMGKAVLTRRCVLQFVLHQGQFMIRRLRHRCTDRRRDLPCTALTLDCDCTAAVRRLAKDRSGKITRQHK